MHKSLYFLANSMEAPRCATLIVLFVVICELLIIVSFNLFITSFNILQLFSNISNYNNLFSFSPLGMKFCNIESEN